MRRDVSRRAHCGFRWSVFNNFRKISKEDEHEFADANEPEDADIYGRGTVGLLIAGFQGVMPWTTLAIIGALLFVLTFSIPSKYNSHLITFGILVWGGGFVVAILPSLFGGIPYIRWVVFVWLAIAVAVGALWPFPVLKRLQKKAMTTGK